MYEVGWDGLATAPLCGPLHLLSGGVALPALGELFVFASKELRSYWLRCLGSEGSSRVNAGNCGAAW